MSRTCSREVILTE